MPNYYKLIWSEEPIINDIPGFVWPDEQTAIAHYDDFIEWTYGETETPHLYVVQGPKATQCPVSFASRLSYMPKRRKPQTLSSQEARAALEYFGTKPPDFFSLAIATERDELLFLDLAATVGVLKSYENKVLDEYFMGVEGEMHKIR